MMDCIFCDIVKGTAPSFVVEDTPAFTVFLDIDPITVGHLLIVPKQHWVEWSDLDEDASKELIVLVKRMRLLLLDVLKPDGVSMMQNGGFFNEIGHFHFHVFPRFKEDGFSWNASPTSSLQNTALASVHQQLIEGLKSK